MTKEEKSEYNKIYYQRHKEKIIEKSKEWYEKNKEKTKEWYEKNKEKRKLYKKINKKKINEKNKEWYEKNKEKRKLYIKTWTKINLKKKLQYNKNYLLKLNLFNSKISQRILIAWAMQVKERDRFCRYCGSVEKLHAHHILSKSKHPEFALFLNNGISLCELCHIEEHRLNGYL
jgi:hypothetical protein